MASNNVYIMSPIGRIVQGHPTKEQTTGYQGQPLVDKKGQPKTEFYFAIAVEKQIQTQQGYVENPEWPTFWGQITAVGQRDFPGGQWQQPNFKWKISDGDDPKYAGKDGHAGCYIVSLKSSFSPNIVDQNCQVMDGSRIKRGDFVRVQCSVSGNDDMGVNSGIYINPSLIQFMGYGAEILSGPDPREVFGNAPQPGYTPAGMSQTPTAPAAMPGPGTMPLPGQPMQQPPGQPMPNNPVPPGPGMPGQPMPVPGQPMQQPPMQPGQPMQPQQPQQPVQPAYDFLNPAGGQPMQQPPMQPAQVTPAVMQQPPAAMPVQQPPPQPVAQMPGQMPAQPVAQMPGMPGVPQQPVAQMPGMPGVPG